MEKIKTIINDSLIVHDKVLNSNRIIKTIEKIVDKIVNTYKNNGKVLLCGNGGSASDAQHISAELSGKFYLDRAPLFAEALHVNTSYLTAVANDYSYEDVYSRLLEGISKSGDVLIGISTSGNSKNIIKALQTAKLNSLHTISFTGLNGGFMKNHSDYLLNIPSENTPRIQECHILVGHIICQMVEEQFFQL